MLVHALISAIWADPEPTVFSVLDSFDKELADLLRGGPLGLPFFDSTTLRSFSSSQSADVSTFPLLILLLPGVLVQASLLCLPFHLLVVRELAFFPPRSYLFLKNIQTTVFGSTPNGTF